MSIGVLMSVTLAAFQSLGVGTAMPDVARDLGGLGLDGWAFSAFMLASVVGAAWPRGATPTRTGRCGPTWRRSRPSRPGSLLAALAWSWGALLAGRALEGLGSGALGVVTYASASRAYPQEMYGRMLALMSSAWVLPSLAGPALAGIIAETTTWRWVFVFLLPFLPVAVVLTRPGLPSLAPVAGAGAGRGPSLRRAGLLAAGLAAFLAALELATPLWPSHSPLGGLALAVPPLRALLLPAGTLRAARGLPSGILVRGLLAVAFLGGRRLHAARADRAGGLQPGRGGHRDQHRVAELEPGLVPPGRTGPPRPRGRPPGAPRRGPRGARHGHRVFDPAPLRERRRGRRRDRLGDRGVRDRHGLRVGRAPSF